MAAAAVAEAGYRGAMRGRRVVIPGLLNRAGAFATRFVPRSVLLRVVRRVQERKRPA
jgi:short-subunit dehydrogenase